MSERTLSVLDGSTFVVGDRGGDRRPGEQREHGFFSEDTRFLSRWILEIDGATPELLSLDQDEHFAAQFVLAPRAEPEGGRAAVAHPPPAGRPGLAGAADRHQPPPPADRGHAARSSVDADFADLFEVKDGAVAAREITCS